MNYYNEWDPHAAAWLRELITQGLIPDGHVDERSICDVAPADLAGYTQCHFFAGIGGWSYALELAGWPADRPVWTGSCPCQPFSAAGKGLAQADERHLWPELFRLIRQCRPELVFGEQVANAVGHGWLDGVSTDLESENYVCGAAVLGAHSVRSPHIRQRLWWVANTVGTGSWRDARTTSGAQAATGRQGSKDGVLSSNITEPCGADGGLAVAQSERCHRRSDAAESTGRGVSETGGGVGDASLPEGARLGQQREQLPRSTAWSDFELIHCADGKARRIESDTFPLAHGVPGRVGLLRGYGNAIVPAVAAQFIKAFVESVK